MILTKDMYVPALRWRQGEYQALFRLTDLVKDRVVPFITVPEIEFDFEEWRPKKTIHEHVQPFPARYKSKWAKRPAWVGLHKSIAQKPMDNGQDIFTYVFEGLRAFEANAVPSIPLGVDASTILAVAAIAKRDSLGMAISVRLEDLMRPSPHVQVQDLVHALGGTLSETDLIVDLGAPKYEPYEVFSRALISALLRLGDLQAYRNFVIIGTAIPETFKDIAKGTNEIPRHDWLFYQELLARLPTGMRRPNFGDYTIVHPEFTVFDMRKIKSAGKIVYTTPRSWSVRKGGAFRDNPEQMHDHCVDLVSTPIFKGAAYSSGDDYIARCAVRQVGPSNQPRWKDVTINHHITHVLDDLATLDGAS